MSVASGKRTSGNSLVVLACSAALTLAACSKKEDEAPKEAAAMPSTALEGALDIVAWPGYIERGESDKAYDWVTQFEADTGCKVNVKLAATSDEMVTLMIERRTAAEPAGRCFLAAGRQRALRPRDRLGRCVAAPDPRRHRAAHRRSIASRATPTVDPRLQEAGWHYVDGKHWGVPYQWGPNVLMYNTKTFKKAPTSWSVVFEAQKLPDGKPNKGRVQAYDGPIYIADAALYLASKKPELGIKDPYELNETQYAEVLKLLRGQHPLIQRYWHDANVQVQDFQNEGIVASGSWPFQANTLLANKATGGHHGSRRRRDRLGRHHHAGRGRQASELRLQVARVVDLAEGAG